MTVTSDERREVANSLRARAAGVGFAYRDVYALNNGWVYRTLREIAEAIGCAENPHPAEWMTRLADLIDPTCEMVVKYGHACCGRCGHVLAGEGEVEEGYYEFRPFCPDCGARVVRDDA